MNASEDETEPLGEAPEVAATKHPALKPITLYQAQCTSCGTAEEEYGEFSCMDEDGVISHVRDNLGWFERTRHEPSPTPDIPKRVIVHTVELLCPDCQRCDACGAASAYVSPDDDQHMVCADHEDYFAEKSEVQP